MTIQEKVEKTIIKLCKEKDMSQETFAYALPLIQVVNFNKTHNGIQFYKKKSYLCKIKQIDSDIWLDLRISK